MSDSAEAFAAQTQTIRDAYAALNRNDIPAMIKDFDAHVEWSEPAELSGKTYRGLAAVSQHIAETRAQWAEGSCDPQEFIPAGAKIVTLVHVRAHLKHEQDWREGKVADVFTFHDGKVTHIRTFLDKQQALDWGRRK